MTYEYKEGIALAEAAFEATGKTLKELFTSCANAFIDTTCNPKTIKPTIKKKISLRAENTEKLLYAFLDELIFIKDSEGMICNKITINNITEKKITAKLTGDKANPKTQELRADIKAITMHKFKIEKTKTQWKALVVMDI